MGGRLLEYVCLYISKHTSDTHLSKSLKAVTHMCLLWDHGSCLFLKFIIIWILRDNYILGGFMLVRTKYGKLAYFRVLQVAICPCYLSLTQLLHFGHSWAAFQVQKWWGCASAGNVFASCAHSPGMDLQHHANCVQQHKMQSQAPASEVNALLDLHREFKTSLDYTRHFLKGEMESKACFYLVLRIKPRVRFRVKVERSEKQSSQLPETSYLY